MSSSLISHDSETKSPTFYCRKEKSLGVLCTNFFKLYDKVGVDSIGLDNAAFQLGVERRRLYDIVNILESIGVLTRKAKNQYTWKGFGEIPQVLDLLKEQGFKEKSKASIHYDMVSDINECRPPLDSNIDKHDKSFEKVDTRKEKSLGLLTQNFVKLFLCSNEELISLDKAASALLGDIHDPTAMRTKVRRLYDIANVFASMNLIEKMRHPDSGKPAFRWIGVQGHPMNGFCAALSMKDSKKRVFGSDITNTGLKRCKADYSFHRKLNVKDEDDKILTEQHQKLGSKDFVFGPFTSSETKNNTLTQDRDNLASLYHPRYCNEGNLFGHYVEAWKLWYDESDQKKQIKLLQ